MTVRYVDFTRSVYQYPRVPSSKRWSFSLDEVKYYYDSKAWNINTLDSKLNDGYTTIQNGSETQQQLVQKDRENNPFDSPPGVGYKAKLLNGEFVPPKFMQSRVHSASPMFYIIPSDSAVSFRRNLYNILQDDDRFTAAYFNTRDVAISNLYASLRKRQQFNAGIFLAELRESVGLIGNAAITIFNIVRALKRGRVSDALKEIANYGGGRSRKRYLNRDRVNSIRKRKGEPPITKAEYASSMWLELQFGWKPILNDINSIITIVSDGLLSDSSAVFSVSGRSEISSHRSVLVQEEIDPPPVFGNTYMNRKITFEGKAYIRRNLTATYRPSSDVISLLSNLGLINPLSVAWEVVPFSFVIDWFIPVNKWLNSLTADAGLELLDLSETIKVSSVGKMVYHPKILNSSGSAVDSLLFEQDYTEQSFLRQVDIGDSIPDFPINPTSFIDILQPWKIITASALLSQLFGRN
jgi:hypothetical protein